MRLSDLQTKTIVNVADGKNIGSIIDANIDSSGNINITISAGSSYKNYYFKVYIRYDNETKTFMETGPIKYGKTTIKLLFTRSELANGG